MYKVVIRRIIDPTLNGYCIILMKHITQWAIIQNHDLAEVGLDGAQILDEGAVAIRTVLAIEAAGEEFALPLEPVDNRVCVLLH